jgi:hypothetical protein
MNKPIIYLLWTFLCLHTTVSFSQAASGEEVDAIMADINAIIAIEENTTEAIELDAAPIVHTMSTPVLYSSWEIIHRTPMLQGFAWTGSIANFVTPAMYIGTPLQTNMNTVGYDINLGPTNYNECIRSEIDVSFGPGGELYQDTAEDELRDIAKFCAVEATSSEKAIQHEKRYL